MTIVGLKGEGVRLVPLDRAFHLENALRWMNDQEVTASLEYNMGITSRQEEAFFDRAGGPSDTEFHWAILDDREAHVGFIGLHAIHWRHRSATGGIVLGERSAWGRGIATAAIGVRTRFAFATLGLHRVEGHTINPSMRRVYEKAGYTREGTWREKLWRDGEWVDADFYAILDRDLA
ncbi:MAG TPA: GNAT family protein [Isosphaeraceae bacterium]